MEKTKYEKALKLKDSDFKMLIEVGKEMLKILKKSYEEKSNNQRISKERILIEKFF